MKKSIRWINGKEFLLAGRVDNKLAAQNEKQALQKDWKYVRIIKYWKYDYALFVHDFTGERQPIKEIVEDWFGGKGKPVGYHDVDEFYPE